MGKYKYSEEEQELNNVLVHQNKTLQDISFPDVSSIDENISSSEALLESIGYSVKEQCKPVPRQMKVAVLPSWESLCLEAEASAGSNCELESIFTEAELKSNEAAIRLLNEEFNQIHRLDKIDISISAAAGLLGGAIDILLIGIPHKTADGLKAGSLSNYIRSEFDKKFPTEQMEKLANSKISKVPYDAQDNRNTEVFVNGLSAYYHRLLSLGHDPILGFIVGVADILSGKMTTIDKTGKLVVQAIENYSDRKEQTIFAAIAKQIVHFKSDITTSMGLPAPMMALFNLLQFGNIGEAEQTIAEIVQGMYFEGYDFIHFCSMSIPTMIIEVVVRLLYALKRIKEGLSIKKSIPFSLNREKNPKLATMLFIAHSGATAINAGKVCFTENPMAINYPQWIAFAKYSFYQLKWVLIEKPEKRDVFVMGKLDEELDQVFDTVDATWKTFTNDYIILMEPDNSNSKESPCCMSEDEIKRHLDGQAAEYFVFMDDEEQDNGK